MGRFQNIRQMTKIGTGLFYNFSEGFMKMPVSIVKVRNSDRGGNLYFEMPRPFGDMSGVEKVFFSKIQFFNRSFNHHILAEGYARICDDQPDREKIYIQFRPLEACCIRHRKKNRKGIYGRIQNMSGHFFKDYSRVIPWSPLPA
jgi:hypothetical protein